MKYQFCIRFENTTVNSAATKAVQDCTRILSEEGYIDYTLTVWDNANKVRYYLRLIKELIVFYLMLKNDSIVAIQYPLLSIKNVFDNFVKLAKLKGVKFFCIVHDIEALRVGGKDKLLNEMEIKNLNSFDAVIVHNNIMLQWLRNNGFTKKAVPLKIFDYLTAELGINENNGFTQTIVFAGNLNKSTFIYALDNITGWDFNIYGPNFNKDKGNDIGCLKWRGEFSPEHISSELNGSFGLIWDGNRIDKCDEIWGNYLKFNNPHKFSLYLASGIPVIAPFDSAIGILIKEYNIGLLIDNLQDLNNLKVNAEDYEVMKNNVLALRINVIRGNYLKTAVHAAEAELSI